MSWHPTWNCLCLISRTRLIMDLATLPYLHRVCVPDFATCGMMRHDTLIAQPSDFSGPESWIATGNNVDKIAMNTHRSSFPESVCWSNSYPGWYIDRFPPWKVDKQMIRKKHQVHLCSPARLDNRLMVSSMLIQQTCACLWLSRCSPAMIKH